METKKTDQKNAPEGKPKPLGEILLKKQCEHVKCPHHKCERTDLRIGGFAI